MLQVNYSPHLTQNKETTLEDVLGNITSHFVEVSTYTTADHKMLIHIGDVPPLIAPCQRSNEVLNTEECKKSVYLKDKNEDVEGLCNVKMLVNEVLLFKLLYPHSQEFR